MQIQLEHRNQNTILSYDNHQLIINEETYRNSVIISPQSILSPWLLHSVNELTLSSMACIMQLNPEVIIIGHANLGERLPIETQQWLSQQRIGIECMLIGAAARTFNVLLSEGRAIVAGFILVRLYT